MIDSRHYCTLTCSLTVVEADEDEDYTTDNKEESRKVKFCSMLLECFAAMGIEVQKEE